MPIIGYRRSPLLCFTLDHDMYFQVCLLAVGNLRQQNAVDSMDQEWWMGLSQTISLVGELYSSEICLILDIPRAIIFVCPFSVSHFVHNPYSVLRN